MVSQTPLHRNGTGESPVREAARSAAGVWHHVLTLAELQVRLFLVEVGEGLTGLRTAAIVVMGGCVLALAALPVLLVCLALTLVEAAHVSPAAAFAIVALLSLTISGAMVVGGAKRLQRAITVPRSSSEWKLNWSWLKTTLQEERGALNRPRAEIK